jgi:SAM-dependent methyltransferase
MSSSPNALYDAIGAGYRAARVADARIAALIEEALGDTISVVNVGAGSGSYESPQRKVVAVEPSIEMIRQRPRDAAPAIQGRAEALPFLDASVDACTAFLTVHHWVDKEQGLREMRRTARDRVVILTFVPGAIEESARWLSSVYFPVIERFDATAFPAASLYETVFGPCRFVPVPIPKDCTDGFLDAYWSRPEAYLDPRVRDGISGFRLMSQHDLVDGLSRLDRDLRDGTWDRRFGRLRREHAFDAGLRLVIAPA